MIFSPELREFFEQIRAATASRDCEGAVSAAAALSFDHVKFGLRRSSGNMVCHVDVKALAGATLL